jgi:hypothetical protein
MAIIQQFRYTYSDSTLVPNIHKVQTAWLKTLTVEEQEEYRLADIRQKALRQTVVDSGNLTLIEDKSKYLWKDTEAHTQGKPEDEIWIKYFIRFLRENNIKFEVSDTPD